MKYRRAVLAALSVVALASVAAAIAWQRAADPVAVQAASNPSGDSVPASRSMFPKVLNH